MLGDELGLLQTRSRRFLAEVKHWLGVLAGQLQREQRAAGEVGSDRDDDGAVRRAKAQGQTHDAPALPLRV